MAAATSATSRVSMNATLSPRVPAPGWRLALMGVGADHVREHVRVLAHHLGRADSSGF
jgi:hypothetical protein